MEISPALSGFSDITNPDKIYTEQKAEVNQNRPASINNVEVRENAASVNSVLPDSLMLAGLKATPENIELLKQMLLNDVPVTTEQIKGFYHAMKAFDGDFMKALFVNKNGIRPTARNAAILNNLSGGGETLLKGLEKLAEQIDKLPVELKNKIENILMGENKTSETYNEALTQPQSETAGAEQNTYKTDEAATPQVKTAETLELAVDGTIIEQESVLKFTPELKAELKTELGTQPQAAAEPEPEIIAFESETDIKVEPKTDLQPKPQIELKSELQILRNNTVNSENKIFSKISEPETQAVLNSEMPDDLTVEPTNEPIDKVSDESGSRPVNTLKEKNESSEQAKTAVLTDDGKNEAEAVKRADTNIERPVLDLRERLLTKYSLKINGGDFKLDAKRVNGILNELLSDLEAVENEITEHYKKPETIKNAQAQEQTTRLSEIAESINKNITFINDIKNNTFLQIPIQIGNEQTDAELYVFHKKQQKKLKSSAASALLALDLASLGRLEAYVQRNGSNVSCQFRAVKDKTLDLIKTSISILEAGLAEHGYKLQAMHYKPIDRPFTLLDREPDINDSQTSIQTELKIGLDERV